MFRFVRINLCVVFLALGGGCAASPVPSDLRLIERSFAPNDAIACPAAVCRGKPDVESPTFQLDAERLGAIVRTVISDQPRTALVEEHAEQAQMVFVQRSEIFGFPDTIWVQIVDLGTRTSIIAYSRSNYGFWDLGVNRRRLRTWIAEVEAAVGAQPQLP